MKYSLLRSIYFLAVIVATVLSTQAYFDCQHKASRLDAFEEKEVSIVKEPA